MNLDEPLDIVSTEGQEFLKGIQGNILESHKRDYSKLLLATFHTDSAEKRQWVAERLAALADKAVRTAAHERGILSPPPEARPGDDTRKGKFANVLLTFGGYRKLGLETIAPNSIYFRDGMKKPNEWVPGRDTSQWERAYRDGEIDALFLLAGDTEKEVAELEAQVNDGFQGYEGSAREANAAGKCPVDFVAVEPGQRLFQDDDPKRPIEHFGFRDGISQPCFFRARAAANGSKHSSQTPLGVILTEDPGSSNDYGSYMAFLKLRQDVKRFESAAAELARALELTGKKPTNEGAEYAKALMVGRSRQGTPAVMLAENGGIPWEQRAAALHNLDDPEKTPAELNDFDFSKDPKGQFCPFHAHVRKMNPREERFGTPFRRKANGRTDDTYIRLARRGIPYGKPGAEEVGMLFMSFQSNPAQFLFYEWAADSPDFVRAQIGADALSSQVSPGAEESSRKWPSPDPDKFAEFSLTQFVTTKGGEFFFAPSMAVLRGLPKLVRNAPQ